MKNFHKMMLIGLILIVIESVLGLSLIFYGILYTKVEEEPAEVMMKFIKNHNPAYYEKLMNRNEPSYIEEFYKFYTKRGNSLFVLSGIIIVVIVINNAFMMSYMMVSEERVPSKIKHDEKVEEKTKAQRPEENQQV